MFIACLLRVYGVFTACLLHVYCSCLLNVYCVFTACLLHVYCARLLHVFCVFTACLQRVYSVFTSCLLRVYRLMFIGRVERLYAAVNVHQLKLDTLYLAKCTYNKCTMLPWLIILLHMLRISVLGSLTGSLIGRDNLIDILYFR